MKVSNPVFVLEGALQKRESLIADFVNQIGMKLVQNVIHRVILETSEVWFILNLTTLS